MELSQNRVIERFGLEVTLNIISFNLPAMGRNIPLPYVTIFPKDQHFFIFLQERSLAKSLSVAGGCYINIGEAGGAKSLCKANCHIH